MANINFKLNNGKATEKGKEYSIYIRYKFGRKVDIRKAIGFKSKSEDWNSEKQEVKNRIHIKNRTQINNLIKTLIRRIEDFEYNLLQNGKQPDQKYVERNFKTFFGSNDDKSIPKNLFDFISALQKRPDVKKSKASGTLKNYLITENILKRFNNEVYKIDFDNIDMDFYNDFIDWCEKQNLTRNYIGKLVQTFKFFLNTATLEKINTNLEFKNPRFKVIREEVDNIYLSLEELNKIYKLDLSKHPKLDQARNLFLIGAYTGLRVSDFNYLNKENIYEHNGETFLKVKTKKTPKKIVIPLRPEVKEILKKHGNKPPKRMPDQQINYKIKDVCENAGIDEQVKITKTTGGKKTTTKKCKFDLVKTHTARRSFCTNAYLSGMNPVDIMQISGHSSEKTFLNYIKADALQKAIKISSHPFFKGEDC
ncbi:phage integrase SAM-like domain-containing protein [uncultured Polaribacter sp.]|uniref:phage integrase SAM-like domain-containing protein n=1 Tax=uncultured Polaribacter sp. TaxID=174711 RepID=UPI00263430A5|nr:phage integrase SAM-like domain-containing protein [uncultured Polaribacter sp.]